MVRYEPRLRAFAMCLSVLAGFIDATGFVLTGGLFVSFMSGNSARMAVSLADGSNVAFFAGALVALFLAGVIGGALLAPWKRARRKSVVMAFTTAIPVLAAVLTTLGHRVSAALVLAAAMGSLNNMFLREGQVSIGVTHMTGTLVRAGQRFAGAIRGESDSDWLPYLLLWSCLVSGAAAGAFLANIDLVLCVWIAVALVVIMTFVANCLERTHLVQR